MRFTYSVVPRTRGPEHSRPLESILAEVPALLSLQILAFYMIAKVRGRTGLIRHLTRVVGLMGAASLLISQVTLSEGLLSLLVIIGCAALGGWVGARRD